MVSNYRIDHILSFLENIDLIIAEGWMILMKEPCLIDYSSLQGTRIITASMELQCERIYHMNIWMPHHLAHKLALEFYGEDMELDDEMIEETVGEFVNIIAGNLQGIVAQNAVLSPPKTQRFPSLTKNLQGIVRNYATPNGSFIFAIH